jgi:large subunit ribosomal protein L31e
MSAGEVDERVITVPLRDVSRVPVHDRAKRAMKIIREDLARQFGVDQEAIRLDPSVNEVVWARGGQKPPRRIRLRAGRFIDEGIVEVEPAE